MNQILIIGSNSFAGSEFIDYLLNKNLNVIGVSRSKEINKKYLGYRKNKNINKFLFHKINLNLKKDIYKLIKIIKTNKIKYVVNFAAQGMVAESWINPEDWYMTNVVILHVTKRSLSTKHIGFNQHQNSIKSIETI